MTFSLVARCRDTGMFGVAVASSSPAVAARCAYARAGVGAVASQNVTDPTLGPRALDLMAAGATAAEAVAIIRRTAAHTDYRQVLAVDAAGGIGRPLRPERPRRLGRGGGRGRRLRRQPPRRRPRPPGHGRRLRRVAAATSATGCSPRCRPPSTPAARPARSTRPA